MEQITANTQIELEGWAGASVGTSGVSTLAVSWDGEFKYSQTKCKSKNHQLILGRDDASLQQLSRDLGLLRRGISTIR